MLLVCRPPRLAHHCCMYTLSCCFRPGTRHTKRTAPHIILLAIRLPLPRLEDHVATCTCRIRKPRLNQFTVRRANLRRLANPPSVCLITIAQFLLSSYLFRVQLLLVCGPSVSLSCSDSRVNHTMASGGQLQNTHQSGMSPQPFTWQENSTHPVGWNRLGGHTCTSS